MTLPGPVPVIPSDTLVPSWLQRLAAFGWRVLVTLALGIVLVQLAMLLGVVTASILVALIVAATFAPYVRRLRDRGWNRTKAAAVVSLVALGAIVVTALLLAVAFLPYVAELLAAVRAGGEAVRDALANAGLPPVATNLVAFAIDQIRSFIATAASEIAGPIAALVTALILGGFLTFFLLQDGDRAWTWTVGPLKDWRSEAITASGRVALERVGGYLRGTAILAATDAISDFIFLLILGVPLAGPLAVLVFVGGFIPYLGGFIATTVLVLVTLATNGPTDVVILLALITIMNLIQGNLLAPVIYGQALDVHPAIVLVALPIGAALFGILGLFAALPVVAFGLAIAPAIVFALDLDPEDRTRRSGYVPVWLDRLAQWSWRGLIVIGLVAVAVAAAVRVPTVILPVILATVLAATLDPVADALRRRGWSRSRSALTVTLGSALGVIGIVVVTIVTMVGPLQEMLDLAVEGSGGAILSDIGLPELVSALSSGLLENVSALVANIAALFVVLLLATLLTFYFLKDGESVWGRALDRVTPVRRGLLTDVGQRATDVLGGYMVGTGAISLFGAVSTAVLMVILGLPLVLPIAVLGFFLGFIPYIGSFIATALAFLVTYAVGDSTAIVIMFIWTIVFNIVQGNFVAPLVYGRTVSLHPAIVLLAIPAGSALAGVIGMFLVVPFLGVVAATWRSLLQAVDDPAHTAAPGAASASAAPAPPAGAGPT